MGETRPDEQAKLGLIAGAGALPEEALGRLREREPCVELFGFTGITEASLLAGAHETRLGQLLELESRLTHYGIGRVLILGKFDRALLEDASAPISPDREALALLAKIASRDDADFMSAIAIWLEGKGFDLCAQDELLSDMLASPGSLSARELTSTERAHVNIGRQAATELGRESAGQAVAVGASGVLATESASGTDAMIRGLGANRGQGVTIVKQARSGQDRRLDLPAIGPGTIESMIEVGACALAVEAGSTLVIDRDRTRALADGAGLAIWAFERGAAS